MSPEASTPPAEHQPHIVSVLEYLDIDEPSVDQVRELQEAASKVVVGIKYSVDNGEVKSTQVYNYIDSETSQPLILDPRSANRLLRYKPQDNQTQVLKAVRLDLSHVEVTEPVAINRTEWEELKSFVAGCPVMSAEFLHVKKGMSPQKAKAVFEQLQAEGIIEKEYTRGVGYRVSGHVDRETIVEATARKNLAKVDRLDQRRRDVKRAAEEKESRKSLADKGWVRRHIGAPIVKAFTENAGYTRDNISNTIGTVTGSTRRTEASRVQAALASEHERDARVEQEWYQNHQSMLRIIDEQN